MPYKSDKIKIAGTKYDQRVKITDEQKRAIKILIDNAFSQRSIARMMNLSKTSIRNVLNPDVPRVSNNRKPKEYWAAVKRKYRNRKHQLLKDGLIKLEDEG